MAQRIGNPPEWRQFEQMVARIEADAGPLGLVVTSPDRIRSLVTGDLREVDASVRSSDENSDVFVTIECRKRASKEDVTWIEQLATKKEAIGAGRTIAVSSSGFSKQAQIAAAHYGIDLRLVSDISVQDINPNLKLDFVLFNHKRCSIAQVGIRRFHDSHWTVPTPEDTDLHLVPGVDPFADIFRNTDTGAKWSVNDLWHQVQSACDPFAELERGKPPVIRAACFPYPGNVKVDTVDGPERLGDVILAVALSIEMEPVALEEANRISYSGTGGTDLQRIEFRSADCDQGELSVALQVPRTSTDPHEVRTRLVNPHDEHERE